MKKQQKKAILIGGSMVVVLGAVLGGSYLLREKNLSNDNVEYAMLQDFGELTEEEKVAKTQEYIEKSIEETLAGYEFESEEEENKYREILTKHFAE